MVLKRGSSTTVLLALLGLTLPGAALHAQGRGFVPDLKNSSHVGVGYVINVPNQFLGFNLVGITPKALGGLGLYADAKFTLNSPKNEPFLLGHTVQEAEVTFGDVLFEERSEWRSLNFALVYAVTPELALYGGAGYSKETAYRQYFDDSQTRGEFGFYWIEDPGNSGNRVNLLGGGFVRLARWLLFQAGGESKPLGATVGLTLTFALR